MDKIKIIFYYAFLYWLPGSTFFPLATLCRTWYLQRVLKVMAVDRRSRIQDRVYIGRGKQVQIGKFCRINSNVFIQGAIIGDHVMIAPNVAILSTSHHFESIERPMILQGASSPMPPIIEDDVWIGRNCVILPGVRIGKGSVVGAGAVVTRDIPSYGIFGGVPAKLIKQRS